MGVLDFQTTNLCSIFLYQLRKMGKIGKKPIHDLGIAA